MELSVASSGDESIPTEESSEEELQSDVEVFSLEEDFGNSEAESDYRNHESGVEEVGAASRGWGSKKSLYYNANEESSSGDELEEEEAKMMQERLQSAMQVEDYTSHWFQDNTQDNLSTSNAAVDKSEELKAKDEHYLTNLLEGFKVHLKWLIDIGIPAVNAIKRNSSLNSHGYKTLYVKIHTVFCYCINVLYYLQLEMSSDKEPCKSQIEVLSELINQVPFYGKEFLEVVKDPIAVQTTCKKPDSKSIDITSTKEQPDIVSKKQPSDPLAYYNTIRQQKWAKKLRASNQLQTEEVLEDDDSGDKRAITFEMARNKGLMPSRKKEQRNPRVKHRNKYRKALIKRKSQVRPVVAELTRYGGEESGIRSRLARSVTLK